MGQLMDALPKTLDPASRFTLRGHVARPGQTRLRHSMQTTIWFLLPSDGVFRCSSSSLQYYLTRQGRRVVLRGGDVTRSPLERYLNWVPETTPTPPRDHGKENLPPVEEPRKLPRKMRPRRKKEEHHHRPGTSGSLPGTSQSPNLAMSASVKHPQPFQLPASTASPLGSQSQFSTA